VTEGEGGLVVGVVVGSNGRGGSLRIVEQWLLECLGASYCMYIFDNWMSKRS